MAGERVIENLNNALSSLLEEDQSVYLIGEDLLDPYGGAFKASKGLSTRYPDRVLTTPISEQALLGVCNGLALCGQKPIAEIMFGDFVGLGFDQIINVASKAPTMFGEKLDYCFLVRVPVGGNRGYGPTHSQTLQKHFIGIPNLDLYELSPFHDNATVFREIFSQGRPAVFFEDKALYSQNFMPDSRVNQSFSKSFIGSTQDYACVSLNEHSSTDALIICGGGLFYRALAAAYDLFIEHEIECEIVVPSKLYPFDTASIADKITSAERLFVVEESTAGGTLGMHIADGIYQQFWDKLKGRIVLISSEDSVIPSSRHLEKEMLVQSEDIYGSISEVLVGPG